MNRAALFTTVIAVSATTLIATSLLSTTVHAQNMRSQDARAEGATLWGIYGHHSVHDCPVNNRETAEYVVAASKMDLTPLMRKYGVTRVLDRYHSGLEHTFLWAVETIRPHDLEEFAVELGIAGWNDLKFVPLRTFEEGVVPAVAEIHGIDR